LHQWRDLSDQYGFFLLVPEFSKANHPKPRQYHLGNVIDNNDRIRDRADWNFSRVELAFDYYRRKAGIQTNTYELYGHSAGSQFVHRPSLPFASIQSDGSGCRGTLLVWSSSLDLIDKIRA
jgi:hypothetical protein